VQSVAVVVALVFFHGRSGFSGGWLPMIMVIAFDHLLVAPCSSRACDFMVYIPGLFHACCRHFCVPDGSRLVQ